MLLLLCHFIPPVSMSLFSDYSHFSKDFKQKKAFFPACIQSGKMPFLLYFI